MIIINTANGDTFINESETQSVIHDNKNCYVKITFKDGHTEYHTQVKRMYYTNKQDVEIRDNGLLMVAIASDVEYYKQLNESACSYLKRMAEHRSSIENMILSMYEHPDSNQEYRDRFVKELREERSNRRGCIEDELQDYRDYSYYSKLRQDSDEHGQEIEKEFVRLSSKIKELEEWIISRQNAEERIMNRSLWQRILNKKTYL